MYQKILAALLSLLLGISFYAYAQPPIEIIYFKPSDVPAPSQEDIDFLREVMVEVQSFFASEMERHGFGPKTFAFNPDIRVVAGKLTAENYSDDADVSTLKDEIHVYDFQVQNKIELVFLGGRKFVTPGAFGVATGTCWEWPRQPRNPNDCNHFLVVGTDNKNFMPVFTLHEIGHAFGLKHTSETNVSDRINFMAGIPTNLEDVGNLKIYALSREDATFLDESGRLSIKIFSSPTLIPDNITNDDSESIALTFQAKTSENAIAPINPSREWFSWVIGIWEKLPGSVAPPKSQWYFNFPEMDDLSHWMYSHAPSRIDYNLLNKDYTFFRAYFLLPHAELNDPNICTQGMKFAVYADDVQVYSKDMDLDDYGTYIEFEIPKDTKDFTLEIGDLGDMTCDHFVLGEPRLFKKKVSSQSEIDADVNNDGYVDLHDVRIVRSATQNSTSYDTDINNDGVTDEIDVMLVKAAAHAAIAAAAPRKRIVNLTTWGTLKKK